MISLLILGFVLSLDNFRVMIALGAFRLRWQRVLRTAFVFGCWDGLSPLVGGLIGHYFGQAIGSVADTVGPIVLVAYGLYLVVKSLRTEGPEELDDRVVLFGLPVSLSLDNLLTGAGLGILGFSPWVMAVVFGSITFGMSILGLQLGKAAARVIPLRPDLIAGVCLLLTAVMLARGF